MRILNFGTIMKNLFTTLFTLTLLITSMNTWAQTTFKADPENSIVNWKGFKPTGDHYGSLVLSEGYFLMEKDKLVGGEFKMDMNSIKVLDIPADDEKNGKLERHLKNDDFFGVNKYPESSFVLKSSEKEGDRILIKGDLKIKDKTNPVSFLAKLEMKGKELVLTSEPFNIDRSKWDIEYKSKSFFENLADNFIYDDMEISVEVKAMK